MFGSTFVKPALLALAVIGGMLALEGTAQAEDWRFTSTDCWGNNRWGDYFEYLGNGEWMEVIGASTVCRFREVLRTNTYVILEDAGRAVRVQIFYTGAAYIEYPGSRGWRYFAPGVYRR